MSVFCENMYCTLYIPTDIPSFVHIHLMHTHVVSMAHNTCTRGFRGNCDSFYLHNA